ncbi:MAG: hypothetical protein DMF68_08360 [Acidobacteria bacterium]|nr:MAG: hypothetical protein DMF68_08360 [Acidobacteriota bacterium]
MTGQLDEHPLAELIREISVLNLSGALRLLRERAKVVLYFDSGDVIYAASNLRAFNLLECVRRWGVLTNEQLARVESKMSDLEFGKALVDAGMLSRDALSELITRQVSEMLCHTLLWIDGDWDYDPRVHLAADVRAEVKIRELLMESARRLPPGFIASRFRRRDGKLAPVPDANNNLALLPTEAFVLSRVDAPMSISELLSLSGLPESETLRMIYALALGGFLNLDGWPQALTEETVSRAHSIKASRSRLAPTPSKVEQKPAQGITPKSAPEEKPDERGELEALFARLEDSTNYYEMLNVARSASDAELKRAYHAFAKRFHPDRFRKSVDDQLHARIESVFAKIAQAYETLKDNNSRTAYDSKLLKQEEVARGVSSTLPSNQPAPSFATNKPAANFERSNRVASESVNSSVPNHAEEKFQEGLAALHSGNRMLAIGCLGAAARLVPAQPRYRAYYGHALAGEERMRRSAESEIKAAISLDSTNASYRVMLAELYNQIGLIKRAQGELERALSIDPKNEAARRLLDKLKG